MIIWVIGLSGSGKTTLCDEVYRRVSKKIKNLVKIDGDVIRNVFGNDLGHTLNDRRKNAQRISQLCKFLDDQGIHVLCSILSIFEEHREWNRNHIKEYYEVFIDIDLERLIERDSKGLYQKYLNGEIKDVAGFDLDFEKPKLPNMTLFNNDTEEVFLKNAEAISKILIENV